MTMTASWWKTKDMKIAAVAVVAYLVFLGYMTVGLGFDLFRSDVLSYWLESFRVVAPFSPWWVPGYPLLIAGLRAITFDSLLPIAVMLIIAGFGYVIAVVAAYRLMQRLGISIAFESAVLFAVFPFVGLTYSVYPAADAIATATLLLCLGAYHRRSWTIFAFLFAALLLVQKAMWFFALPLAIIVFLLHREARLRLVLAMIPLGLWIGGGALHHGDSLWFLRWSVDNLLTSKSALPVMDGILGSLLTGEPNKVVKGVIALTLLITAGFLAYDHFVRRSWVGVTICAGVILMGFAVNQLEVWAVVRFSKVLIVPLASTLEHRNVLTSTSGWRSPVVVGAVILAALMTNVAYGYYIARFFFS